MARWTNTEGVRAGRYHPRRTAPHSYPWDRGDRTCWSRRGGPFKEVVTYSGMPSLSHRRTRRTDLPDRNWATKPPVSPAIITKVMQNEPSPLAMASGSTSVPANGRPPAPARQAPSKRPPGRAEVRETLKKHGPQGPPLPSSKRRQDPERWQPAPTVATKPAPER